MSVTSEKLRTVPVDPVAGPVVTRREVAPARRVMMWCLWSPRRLLAIVATGLVVILVVRSVTGGPSTGTSTVGAGPAPLLALPVPAAAPGGTVPLVPPAAGGPVPAVGVTPPVLASTVPASMLRAAERFVAVWASHVDRQTWAARVDPLVGPTLRVELAGLDPATVPAHRVTGAASGQGDLTGGTVSVPTDIGPVATIMVPDGVGGWLATTVEPLVP